MNSQDGYSYLAKMQQGARGEWAFRLTYTSEDHDGGLVYPFYLALGRLSAAIGVPLIATYHAARLITGALLLVVVFYAGLTIFRRADMAWAGFAIAAIGSGLGWLSALFGYLPSDMLIPESVSYYAILANPHFPLGIALLIAALVSFLKAVELSQARYAVPAGILTLAQAMVQPFLLITIYLVSIGLVLWHWITLRRVRPAEVGYLLLLAGLSLPGLVNDCVALYLNPVLGEWSSQNLTPSPPFYDFLLGYGLLGLLAALGALHLVRWEKPAFVSPDARRLLLIWTIATVVLLYSPFSLQRRLVAGLHPVLSLLAVVGFYGYIVPRLAGLRGVLPNPPRCPSPVVGGGRRLLALVLVAMVPSNLFLLAFTALGAGNHPYPLYLRDGEVVAVRWLHENTSPAATVLASEKTGNIIPALAGNRVFYGHPFETVRAGEKRALLDSYFAGRMSVDEERALLSKYGIALIYYGRSERDMGTFDPAGRTYLNRVFENGDAAIYRVEEALWEK